MKNNNRNISSMYKDWFLDYASYVILERAVPKIDDGLKPVQRRILHAMKDMHDSRYHKVANIIGQTMQYHPHGDAAIKRYTSMIDQVELDSVVVEKKEIEEISRHLNTLDKKMHRLMENLGGIEKGL